MTKELIENIRAIIVPYMAHDLKRINYENMGEIDAEQFSEDMNEILDLAAKALEQEPIIDVNVPHKIAEFFSDWDGDENAKMEISVNDMREIADIFRKKARAERQLKEKAQDYNPDEWCRTCSEYDHEKHCCPRYNKVIRNAVEEMKQPCEDCISREDAIKQCGFGMTSLLIADNLRRLPPVHPKIKTGHWVEYTRVLIPEPINRWEQAWYCSECGYGNQECEDGSAWFEWKYCPNCGVKMVEPQESE